MVAGDSFYNFDTLTKVGKDAVGRLVCFWFGWMAAECGNPFGQWVMDTLHWVVMVVLRPEQAPIDKQVVAHNLEQ